MFYLNVHIGTFWTCGALRTRGESEDTLGIQRELVVCHVGAKNQTLVLCKIDLLSMNMVLQEDSLKHQI